MRSLARFPGVAVFAFAAFLLLPTQASTAQEDDETIDCSGELANTQLCLDREKAFELRARIDALLEDLPELKDPPWDKTVYQQALATYEEGEKQYAEQYFGDAAKKFDAVVSDLLEVKEAFDEATTKKRELAFSLLVDEKYLDATDHFKQLVLWLPDSAEIDEAFQRANSGSELHERLSRIEDLINASLFDEAETELFGFPSEYWTRRIAQAKSEISNFRRTQSFNSLMSQGLEHYDHNRWTEAKKTFVSALRIAPDSVDAKELLAETESRILQQELGSLQDQIGSLEEQEKWESMLNLFDRLDQLNADDKTIPKRRGEIQSLLDLDTQLEQALSKFAKPLNKQTREDIRDLLGKTKRFARYQRIATKRETLTKEFQRFTTPIKVTVISDRKTEVTIRPGRKLGKFSKKTVSVYPGSYELVGIRKGYRESRRSLEIAPDSKSLEVRIVCDVRF